MVKPSTVRKKPHKATQKRLYEQLNAWKKHSKERNSKKREEVEGEEVWCREAETELRIAPEKKKEWVWNGVHSASSVQTEELLDRKVAAPV
jgi:hypothetical protein